MSDLHVIVYLPWGKIENEVVRQHGEWVRLKYPVDFGGLTGPTHVVHHTRVSPLYAGSVKANKL